MRRVSSSNDKELSVTRLPSDTNLPLKTYEGKDCEVSVGEALTAINNLRGDYVTLDGHSLTSSKDTRRKLGNVLRTGKDNDDLRVALSHVPEILSSSVLVEEHRDRTKVDGVRKSENPSDPNIEKVQVYYGPVKINGKLYRVKTTVPVFMTGNNRIRGYEIGNMELSSPTPTVDSQGVGRLRTSSISLANLLKNVEFSYEKGKKILDEIDKSDSDAPTTPSEAEEGGVLYREVDDDEQKRLDSEPTVKVYRAMQEHDGKLYPPMSGRVREQYTTKNGTVRNRWVWRAPIALGKWEQSEEHPEMANEDGTFTLDKGNGSTINAAYNPYIHTSRTPINDQFSSAWSRPELVTVEVEVPESELTSGYRAERAKDATGEVEWKSGPVGREMAAQGKPRMVILSRWDKPVRIVPVEEVADEYAKRLQGTGISVPFNTVPPALREALVARGVEISEPEKGNAGVASRPSYEEWLRGERREREGNGAYTDDELSEMNDPFVKMLGEKARSAKQRKAFAERERRNMADAVRELAERLHLDNVEIVTEPMEVKDRRGKVHHPKGFYNTKTGKITVVIPNHANVDDAVQTLLHEAVAHYGLRQLFGEHFDTFLRNVYEAADMDVRRRITELALRKYGGDFRVATEEYLASLAEKTDFENMPHGFWQKIKRMFLAMLHAIGFDGFADMGVTLSDNELRYILWRSYENLKESGEHRSILGEAEDVAKQVELKVGNYGDTAAEEEPADVAEELDARAEEIRNMPAIPIKKHDTSREYVREK